MEPEPSQQPVEEELDPALIIRETPFLDHLSKWKFIYVLLLVMLGLLIYQDFHRARDIKGPLGVPRSVNSPASTRNLWVMPEQETLSSAQTLFKGLMIHLGNSHCQQVTFRRGKEGTELLLASDTTRDPLIVGSHDFKAIPGTECLVSGVLDSEGAKSFPTVQLRVVTTASAPPVTLVTTLLSRPGPFSQSVVIPAGSEVFHVEIEIRFRGTVSLKNLSLEKSGGDGGSPPFS